MGRAFFTFGKALALARFFVFRTGGPLLESVVDAG